MKLSGGNTAWLIRTVNPFTAVEGSADKNSSPVVIKTDIENTVLNSQ